MTSPIHATPAREMLKTEEQLQQSISDIIAALRAVDAGRFSARVELRFSEKEALTALATSVNAVIQRLARVRLETQTYQQSIEEQVATIEKQRAAIRELSTPMIEVQAGVLCVPIVGIIDSSRAAEMTSALLTAVVDKKVQFVVIDITGIDVMDTRATDHFLRMARAVRLLGAECVLSGVNPIVASGIVNMGLDLAGITSYRSLRDALQHYLQRRQRAVNTETAGSRASLGLRGRRQDVPTR
jgi:rsbT co-antagonist protein RsbR